MAPSPHPQGLSLHLGLNRVNPDHYEGWDGKLAACEFDARDMQTLAVKQGFTPKLLLTHHATSSSVIQAIQTAAATLRSGDIFFLSYSGHGGQVPDTNHDERDPGRQDETWVLYDRQLVDDELWDLWKKFKRGVRIIVLSDSCHSGTIIRAMPAFRKATTRETASTARLKLMPPQLAAKVYRSHKNLYDQIQERIPAGEKVTVTATVLLISGCQDNQYSLDGRRNGLFTENLRKVWNAGKFTGNHRKFRDRIASLMPPNQTPNYFKGGARNPAFEAQTPFTI